MFQTLDHETVNVQSESFGETEASYTEECGELGLHREQQETGVEWNVGQADFWDYQTERSEATTLY